MITLFIYWSIIALQCCISAVQWTEYVCIYLLPPEPLSQPHIQSHPSGSPQSTRLSPLCCTAGPISDLLHTWSCIYVNPNLPICPTLPFPHCVHMFVLYLRLYSYSANRFICTICFSRFHIYVLI